jgi:hypothetical protein
MDHLLAWLETAPLAQYLRASRWGYAAVSTAHIFGIAVLVGAVLPLNLRLLGLWPRVPQVNLVRVLVPAAAAGLVIAAGAGAMLFLVRAQDYATVGFFQAKLALIGLGIVSAVALHRGYGFLLEGASRARLAGHALISIACWTGALVCGRLIAFVD